MITLTLTPAQLQLIIDALGEMPFKKSAPVLGVLQQQYQASLRPAKPEVETPVEVVAENENKAA